MQDSTSEYLCMQVDEDAKLVAHVHGMTCNDQEETLCIKAVMRFLVVAHSH